jgi:hypothetical protein
MLRRYGPNRFLELLLRSFRRSKLVLAWSGLHGRPKCNKAYEAYQQAVYRDGRNPTF